MDYQKIIQEAIDALERNRELAKSDPETYLPQLANSLLRVGAFQYSSRREFEEAAKFYEEGLEIYRKLAETNPATYLPKVLSCLTTLARLYGIKKEYEKAEKIYLEVLQLKERLNKENPEKKDSIAKELFNLSIIQHVTKKMDKAEESCRAALQMARKSNAYSKPSKFVADIIHVLARIQNDKKEFDKAEKSYQEAFEIYQKLEKIAHEKYELKEKNFTERQRKALEIKKNEKPKNSKKTPLLYLQIIRIYMGVFYQISKPNRELSIQLTDEGITNLTSSIQFTFVRHHMKIGLDVLSKWGINTDEYLAEKNIDLSEEAVSDGFMWDSEGKYVWVTCI